MNQLYVSLVVTAWTLVCGGLSMVSYHRHNAGATAVMAVGALAGVAILLYELFTI